MNSTIKKLLLGFMAAALFIPLSVAQIRPIGGGIQRINNGPTNTKPTTKPAETKPVLETSKTKVPEVTTKVDDFTPSTKDLVLQNYLKDNPQPNREWVVMVYINAKNNLDAPGMMDVFEMEEVGSTDRVGFVVEVGRYEPFARQSEKYGIDFWSGGRRYLIMKNEKPAERPPYKITSPFLFKKSSDMGDVNNVIAFAQWTKQNFPAQKYMLILWNHGAGFVDPKTKGISFDDKTGNYIRTTEISQMLNKIGGVDVFATDACLMQMLEVSYHARTNAKFIVGAEELQPGLGYDYTAIGKAMNAKSTTPREASKIIVDTTQAFYKQHYNQLKQELTQSSIEGAKILDLMRALDNWTKAVMSAPHAEVIPALTMAKDGVLRFTQFGGEDPKKQFSTYADLGHFVKLVAKNTTNQGIKQQSELLLRALKNAVVATSFVGNDPASGTSYGEAMGIAIGVPRIRIDVPLSAVEAHYYERDYFDYPFVKKSNWGNFYKWMTDLLAPAK